MRPFLLLLLLVTFASGANSQTDDRLYGAWVTTIEAPPEEGEDLVEMWMEFDARGQLFLQIGVTSWAGEEYSSMLMEYMIEDGQIVADNSPVRYSIGAEGNLQLDDTRMSYSFTRPGAVITGLDVIGVWEVVDGSGQIASFTHNRRGRPEVAFHLAGADPQALGYQPHDEGTWLVSASGLTADMREAGAVTYTGIARDGVHITLTAASGASLTLQPLADEEEAAHFIPPSAGAFSVEITDDLVTPVEPPAPPAPVETIENDH